jgi:anthranilate synthase component II
MQRVFLLDNLDSFTHNLVQQLRALGADVCVQCDVPDLVDRWRHCEATHLLLSPGPLRPENHKGNHVLLRHCVGVVPVLGVCLGMQAINHFCGGTLRRDTPPVHGQASAVRHESDGLFQDVAQPMLAARYHSLCVDELGDGLVPTAWTDAETIMAVRHTQWPLWGVQFHPESFLTSDGDTLIRNFLSQ